MTDIKPALTTQEWERPEFAVSDGRDAGVPFPPDKDIELYGKPHAIAAVALYGQSFGFTREDVEFLREEARCLRVDADNSDRTDKHYGRTSDVGKYFRIKADRRDDLANRIEALLPPE